MHHEPITKQRLAMSLQHMTIIVTRDAEGIGKATISKVDGWSHLQEEGVWVLLYPSCD